MKPFNLIEYFANPSKQIITRDGRNVRILCTNKKGSHPVVALIEDKINNVVLERVVSYYDNGRINTKVINPIDLFFNPEKKEGWINIFKSDTWIAKIYNSKTEAEESVINKENYINTIKIMWEE